MRGSKKDISTRESRDSGDCTVPRPILNVMYLTIGVSSVSCHRLLPSINLEW
jgi:hypothetical protein